MKSLKPLLLVILTGLLFSTSCMDWNCIEGNGRTASVRRETGSFKNVTNAGDFVVDVSVGTETSVIVEADENLLPYISTYIQGNTLYIETNDRHCLRSSEQIYVHVITPSVYELKLSGSGVIYCDNVNATELKYVLSGSGDIKSTEITADFIDATLSGSGEIIISGTADHTDFLISGSGNIKAQNLEQNECIATISGSGNIYTWVHESLNVFISGSGNVVYKGSPALEVKVTGSGRVISN